MNEDDMRVRRTQRALRQALIDLIIEQDYETVTVRAIIQRAQVGNKTFYRHYQDKESLLHAILSEMLAEGQALFLSPTSPVAAEQNTINLFRYAERYADLFRVLLRSPLAETLIQPVIDFGLAEGRRFFGGSGTPDQLVAYHFVSSLLHLVRWWLEQGRPHYSPDRMAEYANRLLIRPISGLR